ncbi:MAG: PadR family transcriptional regulator [Dehalococcoidales bacterium]|nr:PadR family transcriptional regulator [Dehalococcoidales bacterium]
MFRDLTFRPHHMFHKGHFKYLILDLLKDKPYYGYEIMQAMEEHSHGFYKPSPGVVYPTLQMLEEMGYATSSEQEGKRVYSITESGISLLSERRKYTEESRLKFDKWCSPEVREKFHEVRHELRETGRLVWSSARGLNREKLEEIKQVVLGARKDIQTILERSS